MRGAQKGHSRDTGIIPYEIIRKLENAPQSSTVLERMQEMSAGELGDLVNNHKYGAILARCVRWFPTLHIDARVLTVTRTVARLELAISCDFEWNDKYMGASDSWWVWVEDSVSSEIYAYEYLALSKRQLGVVQKMGFVVPIAEPIPQQLYVRAISDRWIGAETVLPVSFRNIILPECASPHTDLLDLRPLPISALQNADMEEYFEAKFSHFNPIQTQVFHTLYNTDHNVLLGAPTSSGKTVCAELAMFRTFNSDNRATVVYIAPMKALVRERVNDWSKRLAHVLDKTVVEITGDVTPDVATLRGDIDLLLTTPEKFDGLSRSWVCIVGRKGDAND